MIKEVDSSMDQLDQEWIDLILDAIEIGMSVQDIQTFLKSKSATTYEI